MAARSDIVFAGDDEARLLVDDAVSPEALARGIADLGPREVLIKLGSRGCVGLIDGAVVAEAAVTVPVVDTVGAGDAFVAGYLAARVAGEGPAVRLRQAVAAGAFACLHAGDWEGLPRRDDLTLLTAEEPVTR